MEKYPFIFSDQLKYRLQRHISFWLFWVIFQGFLYSFVAFFNTIEYWRRLPASMAESVIFLATHMFLAYALMYFVIPKFVIKQRYWLAACWVLLLFFVAALISAILSITVIPVVREAIMGPVYLSDFRVYRPRSIDVYMGLLAGLRGGITIGGIAASIKLMKHWYVKQQRNLQLEKENIASQLQLLKAQVHPHFLFNTLNNIYSYTQNTSATASQLVIGLSDMLRYMLYECNQPLVPLSKEIKMLRDYCSLEQVRYEKHLDLQITMSDDEPELYIAPLLLLPFVENCFKHGASNLLEDAWISLDISITGDMMKMKLINSKPVNETQNGLTEKPFGIGITNVQTRLNLLYKGTHELNITSEADLFIVNLTLKLQRQMPQAPQVNMVKTQPRYAIQ